MLDLEGEPVRLDDWVGRVVVPNSHGETFAALRLDPESWSAVTAGLSQIDDPLTRAVLWSTAFDLVHHRELSAAAFLDLVRDQLPTETDPGVAEAVIARTLVAVVPRRVRPEEASDALARLGEACADGLRRAPAAVLPVLANGVAAASRDVSQMRTWWRDNTLNELDPRPLAPALSWALVHRLAELGELDEDAIDDERRRDPSTMGELGAATALAARPESGAKAAAWEAMLDPDVANRLFEALARGLWSTEQPDLTAPYVARYLTEGPGIAERRGPTFAQAVGKAFPTVPLTQEQVGLLDAALAGDLPVVLRRFFEDRRDDLA